MKFAPPIRDALNAVLHDRWKQLDFCWNVQMGGWERFKTHPALTADEQKLLRQTDPRNSAFQRFLQALEQRAALRLLPDLH